MNWKPIESIQEFHQLWEAGDKALFRAPLPDDVARQAIEHSPEARMCVAMNKTISDEILRLLARDEDEQLRRGIAQKRKTPADVMMDLARDPSASVRSEIAGNAKAPLEPLRLLADDEVDWLREQVRKRLRRMDSDDE